VNESGTYKHSTLSLIQQSQTSIIATASAGMTYLTSNKYGRANFRTTMFDVEKF